MACSGLNLPATTIPIVTAGLKCPPEMCPTAYAIANTDRPTAKATATSPTDGAEKSAEPQTALTSVNVPTNSAANSRCILKLPKIPQIESVRAMLQQPAAKSNRRGGDAGRHPRNYMNLIAVFPCPARLQCVGLRHGDDIVAGINEVHFAGHSAG